MLIVIYLNKKTLNVLLINQNAILIVIRENGRSLQTTVSESDKIRGFY
jgi:hypothetical protein